MAGWAMPTTVAARAAIELPSTVAVSTQRPRAVERRRPSAPLMASLRVGVAESVTPGDVAVEAGGLRVAAVRGVALAAVADGGVRAVAGHDQRLLGQRQQLGGDARDDGLEVAPGRGLSRSPVEERVAGDNGAADAQGDAARSVPGGMEHGDAR